MSKESQILKSGYEVMRKIVDASFSDKNLSLYKRYSDEDYSTYRIDKSDVIVKSTSHQGRKYQEIIISTPLEGQ